MTSADPDWVPEMFVEMVDELEHTILQRAGDGEKIKDCEMLNIFAQAYSASVRTNRDAELCGHEEDG